MNSSVSKLSQKVLTSIALSAAIFAIATMDGLQKTNDIDPKSMMASGDASQQIDARSRFISRLGKNLKNAPEVNEQIRPSKGESSSRFDAFMSNLAQAELGDRNPFSELSTLAPFERLLAKGIKGFERAVFRSDKFVGEVGYDLIHYTIQQNDGSVSEILAYLDQSLALDGSIEPVVIALVSEDRVVHYSLFRNGLLTEEGNVDVNKASTMVAQRVEASVPFMSVAR